MIEMRTGTFIMAEKIRLTHRKLQVATWDYKRREPASSHPAGRCHQRLLAGLNFRFANALELRGVLDENLR
jgi:hypothetical protein